MTDWIGAKTRHAPMELRDRLAWFVDRQPDDAELPVRLSEAGTAALQSVLAHGGDRTVALDLLTADALITLALLAQAEMAPDQLATLATSLVQADLPGGGRHQSAEQ